MYTTSKATILWDSNQFLNLWLIYLSGDIYLGTRELINLENWEIFYLNLLRDILGMNCTKFGIVHG